MQYRKLKILLIEDDTIEVMKFKRALLKLGASHEVVEAKDGEIALDMLLNDLVIPDIIFLDLNMPRMNGLEFLSKIKMEEKLQFIPVMVLTTSSNNTDVLNCYIKCVAGYVQKPLKYEDYVSKLELVLNYWSITEIPSLK